MPAAEVRRALEQSWVWDELRRVRNIRPSFRWGLWAGLAYSALDTYVLARRRARGRFTTTPTTRSWPKPATLSRSTTPAPTARSAFDRLSSVFISNTNHEEDQPSHLQPARPAESDCGQLSALRFARTALLSGRRLRDRAAGRDERAVLTDQRAELRSLQNLRHQGSGAEHRLGCAGGRRRTQLSQHVIRANG